MDAFKLDSPCGINNSLLVCHAVTLIGFFLNLPLSRQSYIFLNSSSLTGYCSPSIPVIIQSVGFATTSPSNV
jgi:hypothetical protein